MWYEDHLSPGTLEASVDGTRRTMTFPVCSAGQWAVTKTVQLNPVPTRVCSRMRIVPFICVLSLQDAPLTVTEQLQLSECAAPTPPRVG